MQKINGFVNFYHPNGYLPLANKLESYFRQALNICTYLYMYMYMLYLSDNYCNNKLFNKTMIK